MEQFGSGRRAEADAVQFVVMGKHFLRRAVHGKMPLVQHEDAVRQPRRVVHVVADEQNGEVPVRVDLLHHVQDVLMAFRIQSRRRFVQDQHLGIHRQNTRDRDPPLFAAGQFERRNAALYVRIDAHELQGADRLRFAFLRAEAVILRTEADVFQDGLFEQLVLRILEHQTDFPAGFPRLFRLFVDIDAVRQHAAVRGLHQAVQVHQQRGFAAARMADDRGELAAFHGKTDALERHGFEGHAFAVDISEISDFYPHRHSASLSEVMMPSGRATPRAASLFAMDAPKGICRFRECNFSAWAKSLSGLSSRMGRP